MSATKEFNQLHGKEVLNGLNVASELKKNTEVVSRSSVLLKNNPGIDWFVIKITNQIKENPMANTTVKRKSILKQKVVANPLQRTIRKLKTTSLNNLEPSINNPNSLAYRLANRPENVEYYDIANLDIAEYIGEIEKKTKNPW